MHSSKARQRAVCTSLSLYGAGEIIVDAVRNYSAPASDLRSKDQQTERSLLSFVANWYTDVVVFDVQNLQVTIAPARSASHTLSKVVATFDHALMP